MRNFGMAISITILNILSNRFIYTWPIIMITKKLLNTSGTWMFNKLLIINFFNNGNNITSKNPKTIIPI